MKFFGHLHFRATAHPDFVYVYKISYRGRQFVFFWEPGSDVSYKQKIMFDWVVMEKKESFRFLNCVRFVRCFNKHPNKETNNLNMQIKLKQNKTNKLITNKQSNNNLALVASFPFSWPNIGQ